MSPKNSMISSLQLAGFATVAFAFGVVISNWTFNDQSFEKSFQAALAEQQPISTSVETSAVQVPISGTEDYWLGQTRFTGPSTRPVVHTGPFKLGDQLTIASSGRERFLTVVNISELPQPDTASRGPRKTLLMVTLEERTGDTLPGRQMRIIVNADKNDVISARIVRKAHAL